MGEIDSAESEPKVVALPKLGATLGSYKLLKLIGVGGMGRVYVAEHVKLGRKVALKLLLPEFAASPEVVQRFFNEARAVNQINHPNIVEVMDFVEDPHGFNYFIMELLEGRDLRKVREKDGPFLLGRTLAIAKQVASALAAAHGQGIIHRDIKPDNVLLVPREENPNFVKLLDFGIAKLSSGIFQEQKTRIGMVLGTPGYMSPEQAFGRPIDGRSDVYSLGVLLHWMLVDKLPSAGNLPMKSQHPDEPPADPLTQTARGQPIPPPIAQLVERCLRFDPDDRVQTMERVLGELKPHAPTAVEPAHEDLPPAATVIGAPQAVTAPASATAAPAATAAPPVDPWARTVAPQPSAVRPPPSEGETRIKSPGDEVAPAPPPEKTRSGRPLLIGVAAAAAVLGVGWAALQWTARPTPTPTATAIPIPTPIPSPSPTPTPTPTAPSKSAAAAPPATSPASRPHHPRSPPHRADKAPASKPADDTTILDPLAE